MDHLPDSLPAKEQATRANHHDFGMLDFQVLHRLSPFIIEY